jgi:hypothetical protein
LFIALEKKTYQVVGQMVAYSIVQGGPAPTFLHPLLYNAITNGIENTAVTVEDVIDWENKELIQKVFGEKLEQYFPN